MELPEWVVSCRVHGKRKQLVYCYVQLDGDHINLRRCTCGETLSATCAIDYHRHLYVQRHPMFAIAERRKAAQSDHATTESKAHGTNR